VDVTLSALRQNPFKYQIVSGQLRRTKLRRFPYGLLYVVSDRQVMFLAFMAGATRKSGKERS
jgi:hypothetical protein